MSVSTRLSRIEGTRLTDEAMAILHGLVVAQLHASTEQAVAHEQTARELAGQTELDSVIGRELAEACAARARVAVEDAEHALERFEAGTYGTCEACGAPIPFERLEAIPQARLCVDCPTGHGRLLLRGERGLDVIAAPDRGPR